METIGLTIFQNKAFFPLILGSIFLFFITVFLLNKWHVKKHRFLIILTLIYAFLTFYDLGSFKGSETFYQVTKANSQVVLKIEDENHFFDQIYTTSIQGIPKGDYRYQIYYHDIMIEGSKDGRYYEPITTLSEEDYGKWHVYQREGERFEYEYLRLTFPNTRGLLNEIGLYDSDKQNFKELSIIRADDTTFNPNNLIDENDQIVVDFDYQNETFFDEIYHVRNGYEIAHQLPLYTAVHPLLGTRFIALGIQLFGMNPFGYRFFGALCSVILIPVFYALAYTIFRKEKWANLAILLFSLDFMHYTTGRIATLEPFSILWILLMYLFMVRFMRINFLRTPGKAIFELFLSGLCMALAWATKWTGIYASIGLAFLFFYHFIDVLYRKTSAHKVKIGSIIILSCIFFFVLLPAVIYVFSYHGILIYDELPKDIPSSIKQVLDYIEYSFTYHSGLESTHPYSSKWYMWLLDLRPIWYYVNRLGDQIQTIACFNNPLISVVGLFTMFYTIYWTVKKKSKMALIIVAGYLTSLVPWMFITRTTFAYHYYPSIPFLILGIAYFFSHHKEKRRLLIAFVSLSLLLFILFLPVTGGFMTNQWWVSFLRFLPSWYFG